MWSCDTLNVTGIVTASGLSLDAATTAWVNAVVAAGGAVSDTQKSRVDTLILALKSASLFSSNSRLWIHAGESDAKQATIDLLSLSTATLTASPPLSASGYTGNGSTRFINYGALPANYVKDSASYGAYNLLSSTTQSNDTLMGVVGPTSLSDMLPLQGAGGALIRVDSAGADTMFAGNANRKGQFIASRRGSADAEIYYNGVSAATNTNGSTTFDMTGGFFGLARNNAGTADLFGSDVIGAAWIGGALTTGAQSSLASAINAYMTAWGVNVY